MCHLKFAYVVGHTIWIGKLSTRFTVCIVPGRVRFHLLFVGYSIEPCQGIGILLLFYT